MASKPPKVIKARTATVSKPKLVESTAAGALPEGAAILADPVPAPAEAAPAAFVAPPVQTQVPDVPAAPIQKEATMEQTHNTAINETHAVADKAQAMFGDMNDSAKSAMEKSTKAIEDMNEFAKGNIEALVESSRITAKGIEAMGQDAAEYGRKSFESATAAMKTLASIKSPAEFMKLQADYVRQSFDMMVAESSKNSEAMIKLAGEAMQPISNRVAVAAEKVKIAA